MSNQGYYTNQGPQYPQQRYVDCFAMTFQTGSSIGESQEKLGLPKIDFDTADRFGFSIAMVVMEDLRSKVMVDTIKVPQ